MNKTPLAKQRKRENEQIRGFLDKSIPKRDFEYGVLEALSFGLSIAVAVLKPEAWKPAYGCSTFKEFERKYQDARRFYRPSRKITLALMEYVVKHESPEVE